MDLSRKILILVATLALATSLSRPAKADEAYGYAAVVCKGNKALARFTFAENDDQPVFVRPSVAGEDSISALMSSTPLDPDLDQLVPDNPGECTLLDGREVRLRQSDLGDARGYGQCGGDDSEAFSLWVGNQKIYSGEVWHAKCGMSYKPGDIDEIRLDGSQLTECRGQPRDYADDKPPTPPNCVDVSDRLAHPIPDDGLSGKVAMLHFAPGREAFCRGFIEPVPTESLQSPTATWRAIQHDGLERVRRPDSDDDEILYLNNDSEPVRSASYEGTGGPNGDESVWAILPANATDERVAALQAKLSFADETTLNALRKSGIPVFAGDQTVYRRVAGVHLWPFTRDKTTWMLATSWSSMKEPTDLILRPTPAGTLEEICVFRRNPPL